MTDHKIEINEPTEEADDDVAVSIEEVPVDDYDAEQDGDDSIPPEDRPE